MHGKKSSINALADEITFAMRQHIKSFPMKISHYSGKIVKYLNVGLSVKKIFSFFKEKYHTFPIIDILSTIFIYLLGGPKWTHTVHKGVIS